MFTSAGAINGTLEDLKLLTWNTVSRKCVYAYNPSFGRYTQEDYEFKASLGQSKF